jgi:protein TonB
MAILMLTAVAGTGQAEPASRAEPPGPVSAAPPVEDASPARDSVDARLAEIARRVQEASRYPAIASRRGATGEALIAFEVGPRGVPRELVVARSSGSGALDNAALRAVEAAAPLPFVYGRISVPVQFTLESF